MTTPFVSGPDDLLETGYTSGPNPDDAPAEEKTPKNPKSLLDLPAVKAAKLADQLWTSQNNHLQREREQWKVNALRRAGVPGVKLVKEQDRSGYKAWSPPTSVFALPSVNKMATLCRRMVSLLLADPPVPEPVPASSDQEDIDAAILSGRVLMDLQGEQGTNEKKAMRLALSKACTYGSGFVRYWVEDAPDTVPDAVMASMQFPAGTPKEQAVSSDGTPRGTAPYVERYIDAAGALTDDQAQAKRLPTKRLCRKIYTGENLRFLPYNCEDLWDAAGILIGEYVTWGELKRTFKTLDLELTDEQKKRCASYRPDQTKSLMPVPEGQIPVNQGEKDEVIQDADLVWTLTCYYTAGGDYPDGFYGIFLADVTRIHGTSWYAEMNGQREELDIPVTQYGMWDEGRNTPYRVAPTELLGPLNEIRQAQFAAFLQHLDAFGRRKTFLPTNSIAQEKDLQKGMGGIITINPGGEPKYEDIPLFPSDGMELADLMNTEMADVSGLQQAAQGIEDPSVQSGKHASIIVSQVMSGMSDLMQNAQDGFTRACRIQLQLFRAFFPVAQDIGYTGEDGAYRVEAFRGSDLRSTRDVRLKIGSMTGMNPLQKAELAEHYAQTGLLPPEDLRDILAGNLGGTIGLQDEAYRQRIRRQIATWKKGPPDDAQPPVPPVDPMTGVPLMDPMTGQPAPAPMSPQAVAVWTPTPADELPTVATVRLRELTKLVSSLDYERWPLWWQAPLQQEFARMQYAAGVFTTAQQAQQQAAQQSAQQGASAPPGQPSPAGGQPAPSVPA